MDLSFRWFLSSLSTFVFFISPDAPPSALLIVFIPSDHALSLTSFFPQCQTTFKVVTLVPNLSSWVPLSAYEEFILKLCSRVLEWLTTDLMCLPCWSSANWWFHNSFKILCCKFSLFFQFFLGGPEPPFQKIQNCEDAFQSLFLLQILFPFPCFLAVDGFVVIFLQCLPPNLS